MIELSTKQIRNFQFLSQNDRKLLKNSLKTTEEVLRKIYWKYDLTKLNYVEIILNKGRRCYYRPRQNIILLSKDDENMIYYYPRKACKLSTPSGGLNVDEETKITSTLIHEFTHAIQNKITIDIFSEIETTNNEIYYLKNYKPEYYNQLIPIQKNKYKRGDTVKIKSYDIDKAKIIKNRLYHGGERLYDVEIISDSFYLSKILKDIPEDSMIKVKGSSI